jgi:hypothetical protein
MLGIGWIEPIIDLWTSDRLEHRVLARFIAGKFLALFLVSK